MSSPTNPGDHGSPSDGESARDANSQTRKPTASQAAVYGLGQILSRFVSFLLLPVYTQILTPADYGIG